METAGYADLRAEQAARRERGDASLLGIGMAVYVEVTNGGSESEFGEVEITADGDAILRTGSFSHGQGHETTFAQIVAEYLGLPVERVTVLAGDTAEVARGAGTYGSKSTQIGGVAARGAAQEVLERGKRLAAEQLEADPRDMQLDAERGVFHVAGAPEPSLQWGALARALDEAGRLDELTAQIDFAPPRPTFPFGAHIAVVEVDAETGKVRLRRMISVDDAGRIINPMIADGQIHGGVASGIAQAIHEEMVYDEDGNPINGNFVTYCIPSASEFPQFELVRMETPTPVNPLGAKGIGESGTIGSTPAVHNAVIDALGHLGVRHIDMPVNGERVWRAITEAAASVVARSAARHRGARLQRTPRAAARRADVLLTPATGLCRLRAVGPDAAGRHRRLAAGRRLCRRRGRRPGAGRGVGRAPHADPRAPLPALRRALHPDHLLQRAGPDVGRAPHRHRRRRQRMAPPSRRCRCGSTSRPTTGVRYR